MDDSPLARYSDKHSLVNLVPDRFEPLERLGSGAFGVVYRAYDEKYESMVALKTLHQIEPRHLYHFKREFRSLADISHPNLIDLYELIADEETWFFTMSYVDGVDFKTAMLHSTSGDAETKRASLDMETLDAAPEALTCDIADPSSSDELIGLGGADTAPEQAADAPPLDQDFLREVLVELATGVQALHDYGKLHRDLKPDNVLVTPEGRAVVLDFGLVADLHAPAGATPSDEDNSGITGTPRYLAPELAWDEPLDEPADWYSVGVMLYEVLAGRPPVEAETTIRELYQKNNKPPTNVGSYRPDIDPVLRDLCMDLLSIDPDDRPDGSEILARLGADTAASGRFSRPRQIRTHRERFVGRQRDLAHLERVAEETFERQGPSVVNIVGESGVGKSALADQFLERWSGDHPETLVLWGRCYENESVPYKALDGIIDELVPWLEELPEGELVELLGDGGKAVAQLFPVLRQVDAIFRADSVVVTMSEAQLRNEAFDALRRIIRRIAADHPMIICLDDVQWGDEDSVLLLERLLAGDDPPPVMLVTTWRREDVGASPFLQRYLQVQADLPEAVHVEDLELDALPSEDARRLARRIIETGGQETDIDLDRIVRESGGNPLFVDELSRHSAETGSVDSDLNDLDAILYERIDQLSDSARRILDVVALAGQPIAREMLRRIVDEATDNPSCFSVLRSERLTRLKGTDDERLEPYHDRIRAALLDRLSEERQRAIHLELARAFESVRNGDPETIGSHLAAAGQGERAAGYLVDAADEAADALAFDRAAQLIERALDLGDWSERRQFELRHRLGELYAALGLGRRSTEAYLEAGEAGDGLDTRECRIRACEQMLRTGDFDAGTDLLYEELEALGFSPARNRGWMLGSVLYHRWQVERRGFDFEVRAPEAIPRGDRLLVEALRVAVTMFGVSDVLRGSYFHFRSLPIALEYGYPTPLAILLCQQAAQDRSLGQNRERADALVDRARELLPNCEDDPGAVRAYVTLIDGMLDYFDGDWQPALEGFRDAADILQSDSPGSAWELAVYQMFQSDCLHWLGRFTKMREHVPQQLEEAVEREDQFHAVMFRTKMALLALMDDKPHEADEQLARASSDWNHEGYHVQHFWQFHLGVDAALYRGDLDAARTLVGERWGQLRRSLLAQANPIRTHAWSIYGRVAAATIGDSGGWRRLVARFRARRARRKLRDIDTDCADAFADLIDAQIALSGGDLDRGADLLGRAEAAFDALRMAFHTHAIRLERARLADGAEANALEEEARRWMDQQEIADPESMARLVVGHRPSGRHLPSENKTI